MNDYNYVINFTKDGSRPISFDKTYIKKGKIQACDTSEAILKVLDMYPGAMGIVRRIYPDGYVKKLDDGPIDHIDALAQQRANKLPSDQCIPKQRFAKRPVNKNYPQQRKAKA